MPWSGTCTCSVLCLSGWTQCHGVVSACVLCCVCLVGLNAMEWYLHVFGVVFVWFDSMSWSGTCTCSVLCFSGWSQCHGVVPARVLCCVCLVGLNAMEWYLHVFCVVFVWLD